MPTEMSQLNGTGFSQNFTVVPGVVTTVTLPPADANIIFLKSFLTEQFMLHQMYLLLFMLPPFIMLGQRPQYACQ